MYSSNGNGNPVGLAAALPQPVQDPVSQAIHIPPAQTPEPVAVAAPVAVAVQTELPATIEQIEQACPGAPAEFVLAQVKAGSTVAVAQTSFIGQMASEIAKLKAAPVPALQPVQQVVLEPVAAPVQSLPGNAPIQPEPDSVQQFNGNPVQDWDAKVSEEYTLLAAAGMNRHEAQQRAVYAVVAKHPQLHSAYMAALPKTIPHAPRPGA